LIVVKLRKQSYIGKLIACQGALFIEMLKFLFAPKGNRVIFQELPTVNLLLKESEALLKTPII
jgi:hypothetical protein